MNSTMAQLEMEQEELARLDLSPSSVVLIIGAFEGKTAAVVSELYGCRIHAFEPVPHACQAFSRQLEGHDKVTLHPFALGVQSGEFPMVNVGSYGGSFLGTALGVFEAGSPLALVKMVEMAPFLEAAQIEKIDLCHMNVEGYEFYLLPYMIEKGIVQACRYLMIQFHLKYQEADLYPALRRQLLETHHCRWDVGAPWSSWERCYARC